MPSANCVPSGVTTRRRRARTVNNNADKYEEEEEENNKENFQRKERKQVKSNVLSLFQAAAQSTSNAAFWEKNPQLAQVIIHVAEGDSSAGAMLLSEHVTDILNASRKMVKESTESNDLRIKLNCLCLSMLALHSITRLLNATAKRDLAIKALYHVVTTCEAIFFKTREESERLKVVVCALAAFDLLCAHLSASLILLPAGDGAVAFDRLDTEKMLLPTPRICRASKSSSSDITFDQIMSIGIQVMVALSRIKLRSEFSEKCKLDPLFSLLCRGSRLHHLFQSQDVLEGIDKCTKWITLFALNSVKEISNDIVCHCRFFHRVLWETASDVSRRTSQEEGLSLRVKAISILLLNEAVQQLPKKIRRALAKAHFEIACTNAWKAAASYFQQIQLNSDDNLFSTLATFHKEVGNLLDFYASGSCCIAYAEYCAYRAMHLGKGVEIRCNAKECTFDRLGFRYAHESCGNSEALDVAMQVFFNAVCVKQHLQAKRVSLAPRHWKTNLTDRFQSTFIRSADVPQRYSFSKLFASLSLNKIAHQSAEEEPQSENGKVWLRCCADILSKCIAPLALSIIGNGDLSVEKLHYLWGQVTESYVRAIEVYETVDTPGSRATESAIDALVSALSQYTKGFRSMPPYDTIWKAGKFLFKIGKIHHEKHNISAAFPILQAFRLFSLLSELDWNRSLGEVKFASRWMYLSNIYNNVQNKEECAVASVMALSCQAIEEASERDITCRMSELLEFCTRQIYGAAPSVTNAEPFSRARSPIVSRLVDLFSNRESHCISDFESVCPGFSISDAVHVLLESRSGDSSVSTCLERYRGMKMALGALVQSSLANNCFSKLDCANCELLKLKIITEVAVNVGEKLQLQSGTSNLLFEYEFLNRTAISQIEELQLGENERNVLKVLFHAVYASAVISRQPFLHFSNSSVVKEGSGTYLASTGPPPIYELALRYLDDAVNIAKDEKGIEFIAVVLPAVQLLQLEIKAAQFHFLENNDFIDVISLLQEMKDACASLNNGTCGETLFTLGLSSLARFCDFLSFRGEQIHAAVIAQWMYELCNKRWSNESPWFHALALTRQVSNHLMLSTDSIPTLNSEGSDAVMTEYQIAKARYSAVMRADFTGVKVFSTVLSDPHYAKANDIVRAWVETSAMLGQAELDKHVGNARSAIDKYRFCIKKCKMVIKEWVSLQRKMKPEQESLWFQLANNSLFLWFFERQIECLRRVSDLYFLTSDHKKAFGYLASAVRLLAPDFDELGDCSFHNLLRKTRCNPGVTPHVVRLQSQMLFLQSQATADDLVQLQLEMMLATEESPLVPCTDHLLENKLELVLQLVDAARMTTDRSDASELLTRANTELSKFQESSILSQVAEIQDHRVLPFLEAQIKLELTKNHVADNNVRSRPDDVNFLSTIISCTHYPSFIRSEANYLLGCLSTQESREKRYLCRAWNEISPRPPQIPAYIETAINSFRQCIELEGDTTGVRSKDSLRMLSLLAGKPEPERISAPLSPLFLDESMWRTTTFGIRHIIAEQEDGFTGTNRLFSDKKDSSAHLQQLNQSCISTHNLYDRLFELTPRGWRYICMALTSQGDLLVSSLAKKENKSWDVEVGCVVASSSTENWMESALSSLDTIIQSNQDQLQGTLLSNLDDATVSQVDRKRDWWNARKQFDERLEVLLQQTEEHLFASTSIRRAFLGDDDETYSSGDLCENLASVFEAVSLTELSVAVERINAEAPGEPKLKERVLDAECNNHDHQKTMTKGLLDPGERSEGLDINKTSEKLRSQTLSESDGPCTFLILDENLQRFPFECLPSFLTRTVCRLPSLSFALAKLVELNGGAQLEIDPNLVSYIIDPESNLSNTRKRLVPFIDSLNDVHGGTWEGIVGEHPPSDFIKDCVVQDGGCLLYFGHGGGQSFFPCSEIEALGAPDTKNFAWKRAVKSSMVLMGCSSGRLVSVNERGTKITGQRRLRYEPEGVALSYLAAGSPCVVGNLWDVTDRDIDTFSVEMLRRLFDEVSNDSVPGAVSKSRSTCKLRYLVGAAPVCYGFPVTVRNRRRSEKSVS